MNWMREKDMTKYNMEIFTWPGFPFSHKNASYSDANSGALSLTSSTLIATGTRDI